MASDSSEIGPGVYVIGIDKAENTGPIYEALQMAGGVWRGQAVSLNEGLRQLKVIKDRVQLVVVRADLARSGEEASLLAAIDRWPLVVLLGGARTERKEALAHLPNVRAVLLVPPYDFSIIQTIFEVPPVPRTQAPPPEQAPPPVRSTNVAVSHPPLPLSATATPGPVTPAAPVVNRSTGLCTRLAFFGTRGGVGTSTAALQAARLLAGQGVEVALFDAAQRGDLHVMLGLEPQTQPLRLNGITLYWGEPSEEIASRHGALVVDGGRRHGTFNAQWIEVSRLLDENTLRRLVGLPPVDQPGAARASRRLSLPKFLSIEVTE